LDSNINKLIDRLVKTGCVFSIKYGDGKYCVSACIKPVTNNGCYIGSLATYCERLVNSSHSDNDLEKALIATVLDMENK